MRRNARAALLLALLLALPLAGPAETAAPAAGTPEETAAPQPENYFAAREFTYLDGTPFDASALSGMPVFLNIWATWCPPCVAEMPHLDELAKEYEGRLVIIGLHSEGMTVTADAGYTDNPEANATARELVAREGYTYPILNPDASLFYVMNSDEYGLRVEALPTTWLIDGQGYVRELYVGGRDKEGWKEIIDAFLIKLTEETDAAPQG